MTGRSFRRSWFALAVAACLVLLSACGSPPTASIQSPEATQSQPSIAPTTVISIPLAQSTASTTPTPLLPAASPVPASDLGFSGERAMEHVRAQMQWVPRDTGTPGWQKTGDYIIEQLKLVGWQVEEQRFEYRGAQGRNIIARRGTGPLLLLGAHYDTRKYADEDPDPARQHDAVPGANDGASGVAVLLELARQIDPDKLGREIWLAFFDAEDNGGIDGGEWAVGATYMAQHQSTKPDAMILLDMIGDADLHIYYELNSTPSLRESIWQTASDLGYRQFIPQPKYAMTDDHTPFLAQGIPAVDLIDFDYPPWHTVSDTTDKVSAESLEAVGRTMERWLETRARP